MGKLERENNDQIVIEISGEKDKLDKLLSRQYPMMRELSLPIREGSGGYLVLDSGEAEHAKKNAIDQALETIRNRIDQFGVSEPDIRPQGDRAILIQLPGIKDPERAISSSARRPFWSSSWSMKKTASRRR